LAQAQMEFVQNLPYNTSNPPTYSPKDFSYSESPYKNYTSSISAARIDKGSGTVDDTGIQQITIVIQQSGTPIFTLMGMKVNRETTP
jgi:hypothetical protein